MEQQVNKMNNDKNDMRRVVEERHVEENDYRNFEKSMKDQDRERRKIYKDTLDH